MSSNESVHLAFVVGEDAQMDDFVHQLIHLLIPVALPHPQQD